MSVKIEGIESIIQQFEKIEDMDGMKRAVQKSCALVERSAKKKAPKGETGDLRKYIQSEVDVGGNEIVGTVFNPLEYAPYVEYGTGLFAENGGRSDVPWSYKDDSGEWHTTSGMEPQPFMRPALNENRERIARMLKEAIK